MSTAPQELVVGRIARSHGLAGEVVVEIRTDDPEARFLRGAKLHSRKPRGNDPARTLEVLSVREHANRLLVCFEGVDDRDAADALRGALLVVRSDELPPNEDPDEFYDHELIGLHVKDHTTNELIGTVTDVAHAPGGDWLVTRTVDEREVLIPFVAAFVIEVSLAAGAALVTLPEGLLEL